MPGEQQFSDAGEKKMKDFTALVDAEVPRVTAAVEADASALRGALEELLALEKKTRLAGDVDSSLRVVDAILGVIRRTEPTDWALLAEYVTLLCKRRAQMQRVTAAVIKTSAEWVDEAPDDRAKRAMIESLRAVSEGKMFVELERARLTRTLSEMEERDGNLQKAAELLQEVQVETIGAMEIKEKADFLLEQIRLCLDTKDYVRADIITRKVKPSVLEADELQELKLRYHRLMAGFNLHKGDHLAVCRNYVATANTKQTQADEAAWRDALRNVVIFLALSPHDAEAADVLARQAADKKIEALPELRAVVDIFSTDELAAWPLPCDAEWRADPVFSGDGGKERYDLLHKRIVQHNIRVLSKYYKRIRTARVAELLALDEDRAEQFISEMVSSKQLYAKIDRPAGIVTFARRPTPNSVINDWSRDVGKLLGLVEQTCHLIQKENMMAGVASGDAE